MVYPPIQIVDKDDKPIGGASLAEILSKGLLHRIIYVLVVDEAGKVLLQKRGPTMASFANCWDISTAGHVDEGESYRQAAERELKEELDLEGFDLEEVDNFFIETSDTGLANRFCHVFKMIVPVDTPIHPDPIEVTEVRWFTPAEARTFLAEHPDQSAIGLVHLVHRYL